MDKKITEKIQQKIDETKLHKEEIHKLISALPDIDDQKSFVLGLVIGRLYNSFYYQSKRILNREPTNSEFVEFIDYVKKHKSELESL